MPSRPLKSLLDLSFCRLTSVWLACGGAAGAVGLRFALVEVALPRPEDFDAVGRETSSGTYQVTAVVASRVETLPPKKDCRLQRHTGTQTHCTRACFGQLNIFTSLKLTSYG